MYFIRFDFVFINYIVLLVDEDTGVFSFLNNNFFFEIVGGLDITFKSVQSDPFLF